MHKATFVAKQRSHFFNQSKVDKNQAEIVAAFRKLGWYVLHTHSLKRACDLIILKHGRAVAVEIKDGTKIPSARKLSPGEYEFKLNWEAAGGEWWLVQSVDDVLVLGRH